MLQRYTLVGKQPLALWAEANHYRRRDTVVKGGLMFVFLRVQFS